MVGILSVTDPTGEEWALLGAAALGTALLSPRDVAAYDHIRSRWPNPRVDANPLGHYVSLLGAGEVQLNALLALYVFGGEREQRVARAGVRALAATGLVAGALKYLTGVPRPSDSPHRREWSRVSLRNDAFPSGHTAAAFALAGVMASAYEAGWAAYVFAALVGVSRISQATHWPSDVVAGAALGAVLGRRAYLLHRLPGAVELSCTPSGAALTARF